MSKIKCNHCGKSVSNKSSICIYCGRNPNSTPDEVVTKRIDKFTKATAKVAASLVGLFIIIVIVNQIIDNVKLNKSIDKDIAIYCEKKERSKKDLDKIIEDNDCPSFIYYIRKNDMSDKIILQILDSKNEHFYKVFNNVKNDNLHTFLSDKTSNINESYLNYLIDNEYELSEELVNIGLNNSYTNENKEMFTLYSKLVKGKYELDITWLFNFGTLDREEDSSDSSKSYEDYYNISKSAHEYSLIYHQNSQDYLCFASDLTSTENLKYLISKKDKNVCSSIFYNNLAYLSDEEIKNYTASGAGFGEYEGIILYRAYRYDAVDIDTFTLKMNLYKSVGINFNALGGGLHDTYTILDELIYNEKSDCVSHKNGWGSIDSRYTTKCKLAMQKYKILKKLGAKCSKECSNEKWFK